MLSFSIPKPSISRGPLMLTNHTNRHPEGAPLSFSHCLTFPICDHRDGHRHNRLLCIKRAQTGNPVSYGHHTEPTTVGDLEQHSTPRGLFVGCRLFSRSNPWATGVYGDGFLAYLPRFFPRVRARFGSVANTVPNFCAFMAPVRGEIFHPSRIERVRIKAKFCAGGCFTATS